MRCVFYAVALLLTGFAYAGEGILWQASYGTCVGRLFMTPEAALKACYPDIQRQGWKMIKDPSKPYYYVIGPSLDKEYQNITGYRKVCYKADIKNHGKSDGVSMPKTLPLVHYRRAPKGKDAGQWYPDSFKQCEDGCEMQYNAYTISYTADSDISVVTEKDGTSRKAFTVKRTGGLCETPPPEDPNNPQPPKPDTADDGKPDDGKPGDGKDGGSDDDGSGSGDEGGSGSGSEEGEGETGKDDGEGEGDGSGKDGDSGCTGGDTGGGGCDSGSGSGDSGSADEPVDIWLRCPSGRGSYKKGTKPEGECAAKPADPKKPTTINPIRTVSKIRPTMAAMATRLAIIPAVTVIEAAAAHLAVAVVVMVVAHPAVAAEMVMAVATARAMAKAQLVAVTARLANLLFARAIRCNATSPRNNGALHASRSGAVVA